MELGHILFIVFALTRAHVRFATVFTHGRTNALEGEHINIGNYRMV